MSLLQCQQGLLLKQARCQSFTPTTQIYDSGIPSGVRCKHSSFVADSFDGAKSGYVSGALVVTRSVRCRLQTKLHRQTNRHASPTARQPVAAEILTSTCQLIPPASVLLGNSTSGPDLSKTRARGRDRRIRRLLNTGQANPNAI